MTNAPEGKLTSYLENERQAAHMTHIAFHYARALDIADRGDIEAFATELTLCYEARWGLLAMMNRERANHSVARWSQEANKASRTMCDDLAANIWPELAPGAPTPNSTGACGAICPARPGAQSEANALLGHMAASYAMSRISHMLRRPKEFAEEAESMSALSEEINSALRRTSPDKSETARTTPRALRKGPPPDPDQMASVIAPALRRRIAIMAADLGFDTEDIRRMSTLTGHSGDRRKPRAA